MNLNFSALLTRWKEHILNHFIDRITTGIIEGINNKIKPHGRLRDQKKSLWISLFSQL
ncbi:MAG: hypothetical protein EAZ70_09485 [Runella slithyformis]|nr:MAG: hypothetical protein EAY79_10625 [Runella slithyformis]TAE92847.1 MAG: hypothetical protein EAZ80_11930 [Runella slithyformis]TAF25929.1 MAG: hypothetical protein EAZ70_09485 [Runella slithyformis]TAF44253.1 MAG: hypothetical protein EAZ63_12655 [Runella slithyformis]TAF80026.1 MAG: hypothetical protein EAZ50_09890 [Runella slithyformis]